MTVWRTLILCCICWSTSACDKADEARSAFFCQGTSGPGRYVAFAAVKRTSSGDLRFGVDKWQENGHNFSVFGIAKRRGDYWVYYEPIGGGGEMGASGCKVTIFWPRPDKLAMLVDEKIGCEDHHGRASGWLSSLFTAEDYNGAVRDEFDDDDYATFGRRCHEPGMRHGPIRVVR